MTYAGLTTVALFLAQFWLHASIFQRGIGEGLLHGGGRGDGDTRR